MSHVEIETAIIEEEKAIDELVELLRARTPIDRWPAELREAFVLAVADHPSESVGWQVTTLRRHLFGQPPAVLRATSSYSASARLAERLRAELPTRCPLRGARYLVE